MKLVPAAGAALVAALAAPAAASAGTLAVSPVKPCYRSGETVAMGGSGYTPNAAVQVNSDGRSAGTAPTDATGFFAGTLQLGLASGERLKTYTAVDTANTTNTASLPLRVSALTVSVVPLNGKPGSRVRIGARGFTTGKTLYAHVVRGKYRRNVRIGRLKGACRKVTARKRLFSRRTRNGTYTVQFDSRRHYSKKTTVKVRYPATLSSTVSSAGAASFAQTWRRG